MLNGTESKTPSKSFTQGVSLSSFTTIIDIQ